MSWNDLPGLGTATGTRVDSAAKHIMACKVDYDLLSAMLDDDKDPINALHNEKMKYCMHKDEIVLNTTSSDPCGVVKAYPMVVTTLGDVLPFVKTRIKKVYSCNNATDFFKEQERNKNVSFIDDDSTTYAALKDQVQKKANHQLQKLPDFRCQGVALGQAWASYLSGDSVASVLVGGMFTVMNGHFTMHTGDLVQWYFDFEKDLFDNSNKSSHGSRYLPPKATQLRSRNAKREKYLDERLFGNSSKTGRHSGQKNTDTVVRVKSYKMFSIPDDNEILKLDHYGDKVRVFAKCISGGRPFDAVDIMLMTQSL